MNHYLVITKQEFASLYRFGQLPIHSTDIIQAEKEDEYFENQLLKKMCSVPLFEGEEDYLIIKIRNSETAPLSIAIEDVLEIVPLTTGAKKSFEMKFDPRIIFSDARFENITLQLEQLIDIKDRENGVKAIFKILFPNDLQPSINNLINIEGAYKARVSGKKSSEINDTFYTHLLVYERYEFFPNTDLGYFYDMGEIFANSKGKQSFKGSGFHNFLEKNKLELNNEKLSSIIEFLEKSNDISSFKSQLLNNDVRQYISGALYLKFKSEFDNKDSLFETNIPQIIEYANKKLNYKNEVIDAVCLLGSFYGYKKFYEDLYERSNLEFFKSKSENKSFDSLDNNKINNGILNHNGEVLSPETDTTTDQKIEETSVVIEENLSISDLTSHVTIEESILNQLKSLIGKKEIKIEKEALEKLKNILNPITDSHPLTKDKIVEIILKRYSEKIEIPKKHTLKLKIENSLFSNS